MQQFPAAAVIEAGPAADGPSVVQLPVEGPHAVGFETAPVGDGGFDGKALLDLAEVDETGEIHGEAEIAEHGFGDAGIAALVLLMAFHDGGGDVEIGGVGKAADHVHGGVGLEPEFGTEAGFDIAVVVEIAAFVPDGPEMHVAGTIIVPGIAEGHRAGRGGGWPPVGTGQHRGKGGFDGAVQAIIADKVAVTILAGTIEPRQGTDKFVVAAPEGDAGVVVEAGRDVAHFGVHFGEVGGGGGVEVAGKHEILPDHEAQFIAEVVEPVGFIAAAAPDADHVHVGIDGGLQKVVDSVGGDPAGERVGGDPVGTAGKGGVTVDNKAEGAAGGIGFAVKVDGAQADAAGGCCGAAGDGEGVEFLVAQTGGPPEIGVLEGERQAGGAAMHAGGGGDAAEGGGDVGAVGGDGKGDGGKAGRVSLTDGDVADTGDEGFEPDSAVKAEGCEGDVPVPAEIGLLLAQHVAVGDGAVGFLPGNKEGLGLLAGSAFTDGGAEQNRDLVHALAQGRGDIEAIAPEGIFGV